VRTFYLRIRPDRISLLRFLLEGYEGLAVLSTVDVRRGLVRLLVPACRYEELWSLLAAVCEDLAQETAEDEHLELEEPS
jgi:hypothetical protein